MIKRLFIYALIVLAFASCSDDEKYLVEPVIGTDGSITFTITLPEAEKVVSRIDRVGTTDENTVNKLTLLVFKDDSRAQTATFSATDWTTVGNDIKITVQIDKELRTSPNLSSTLSPMPISRTT